MVTKARFAVLLSLFVSGCSTGARRVDCDEPLVPINVPVPASTAAAAQPGHSHR
jgi:hypothetical protein